MRALLVEDERLLAKTLQAGLSREGIVVDVVHDGITGLWAATENSYDVIILDILLPGLNGYKVLEKLRNRKIWVPVMMLTAKDGDYDQTDAFDSGRTTTSPNRSTWSCWSPGCALVRRGAQAARGTVRREPHPGPRPARTEDGTPSELTAREATAVSDAASR
jgi:two-component system OmpR family response regulator